MKQRPAPKTARGSLDAAAHEIGHVADQVGDQVRHAVKFGVETVEGIASVVESANTARNLLWSALTKVSLTKAEKEAPAKPTVASESRAHSAAKVNVPTTNGVLQPTSGGVWSILQDAGPQASAAADTKRSLLDPRRWVSDTPGVVGKIADTVGIRGDSSVDIREMGEALIRESRIPTYQAGGHHPAFADILRQMNPDEARIVRFLARAGVQPALDVRTKTMFQIGSERILGGVSMIAEQASCRWPKEGRRYLANLNRLGLVRFSPEPVTDIRRYSVLEVQDEAMEAIESVKSAITVYRSIYLSEFGKQFSAMCFDMTGYDAGGWWSDGRHDKIIGSGPPKPKKHNH